MSEQGSPAAVTLGESLGLIVTNTTGTLRPESAATVSFAGAEGNVAIGLARLGHPVTYVSKVGADDVGRMVISSMRGEGVDVKHIAVDPCAPTALMLRTRRTADVHRVAYYRANSAGSALVTADVPESVIRVATVLHVTGITLAVSESAREAALHAMRVARGGGTTISFDVNFRSMLWSRESARESLKAAFDMADIVFGSWDELTLLAEHDRAEIRSLVGKLGVSRPTTVVLKRGADGAIAYGDFGEIHAPAVAATSIDAVGAGDAFAAGYLSGLLDASEPRDCLLRAVECGAFAVSVTGDWEGLPIRDELGQLRAPERVQR